eukprot:CAMPEP_0175170824 /NCGR_PEP_ID=MMETSP0087-20121206/30438_1 /TAXON_ID=136419 /ORGANISM="Unknown Unknown, Strain D1" /LENGTH=175 /DNA_ID=CAMNT_0016461519 /DNA_START=549 /DNA_END=1076 /DNA_ORIENTATION=+
MHRPQQRGHHDKVSRGREQGVVSQLPCLMFACPGQPWVQQSATFLPAPGFEQNIVLRLSVANEPHRFPLWYLPNNTSVGLGIIALLQIVRQQNRSASGGRMVPYPGLRCVTCSRVDVRVSKLGEARAASSSWIPTGREHTQPILVPWVRVSVPGKHSNQQLVHVRSGQGSSVITL